MNILVLGDVVSALGCDFVKRKLPALKRLKNIDFVIANAENSAKGNGVTPESADFLFSVGVDFLTTGNHCFKRKESYDYFDSREDIIRPYNISRSAPGKGVSVIDLGRTKIAVMNLIGSVYLPPCENPFYSADEALKETDGAKIILVDFHAEATSEKQAMGYYLDGRVSAVFGTHTHVQTADERILSGGTGFIADVGMCGSRNSVLGVKKELIIEKLKNNMPSRFETNEDDECMINCCIFSVDEKSGKCTDIERITLL